MTSQSLKIELEKARAENLSLREAAVVKAPTKYKQIKYLRAYVSSPYLINATVTPRVSIVLDGERPNYDVLDESRGRGQHEVMPFGAIYNIGDQAIYDGWNFSYFGEIVAIGPKTVTIAEDHDGTKHRLTIERFCSRNNRDKRFDHDQRANWSD